MTSPTVIVFGPTGAVGSSAARTAGELGAKVVLAMRDTSKTIPGLDAEKEKQDGFQRVTADLTKPDTVHEAVKSTGAKHAFIYLSFAPDGMRSTIEALKSAGIELVVFLSSFTIQKDPRDVQEHEAIPYFHARVEINLEEIFGSDKFVAARGGSFASNLVPYKDGLQKGEVKMFSPDSTIDNIVPGDIGRVCGTVLANGPQDEKRIIYLYGPELSSQRDSMQTLAKVLGKDLKIEEASNEEAYKMFVEERGVPPPIAKWMIGQTRSTSGVQVFGIPINKDDLSNVQKYSGKRATTLEEWAKQNKQVLAS